MTRRTAQFFGQSKKIKLKNCFAGFKFFTTHFSIFYIYTIFCLAVLSFKVFFYFPKGEAATNNFVHSGRQRFRKFQDTCHTYTYGRIYQLLYKPRKQPVSCILTYINFCLVCFLIFTFISSYSFIFPFI